MSFGGFYGPTNEAESMRMMAKALDLGVDFWDTAWPKTKAAALA